MEPFPYYPFFGQISRHTILSRFLAGNGILNNHEYLTDFAFFRHEKCFFNSMYLFAYLCCDANRGVY